MTEDFLDLIMDFGEIIKGQKSLEYYKKGKDLGAKLWSDHGMKSILAGIGVEACKRLVIKTDDLSLEQEEDIKRKNKKGDKKGGKDDKKAAKK